MNLILYSQELIKLAGWCILLLLFSCLLQFCPTKHIDTNFDQLLIKVELPSNLADIDWIFHEFACPVFCLVIHQLKVKEPGQVQSDGHADDQGYEVERRLKAKEKQGCSKFVVKCCVFID